MEWVLAGETDSTNRMAKDLARQGAPHGTAVLAEQQTSGRGRLGRTFFSPVGGLYLSVILRPGMEPEDLSLMTPMAAVAVCRAVEEVCGVSPEIKWVNDLYLEGKKLCGILCEMAGDAVIVGIGLNLRTPEGGFPPQLNAVALDCTIPPEVLAEAIHGALLEGCRELSRRDFLPEYRSRNLTIGKEITVCPVVGQPWCARVRAIDDRGRLVVETQEGSRVLESGDISIRL